MKVLRGIIRAVCVILAVSLALTALFFRKNGVNIVSVKSENDIRPEPVYSKIPVNRYKKIASSGHIELYFDEETTAIMIKETAENKLWFSVPDSSDAATVSMQVVSGDGTHFFNSMSSSVAFSSFEFEEKENGVSVKYIMADDKATAAGKTYGKKDIVYEVSVDYTLKDGNFFAGAEIKNLSGNDNCAVTDFSLLEYFGAFQSAKENDFLVIPDGCGGTVYPFFENDTSEYSCKVYGDDYGVEYKDTAYAPMGAFGIKNGESAFAAVVDSSEELSQIKAVSSKTDFSSVSPHFSPDYVKKADNKLYIYQNNSFKTEICYKFLFKGNATYTDIALSCREQFIRNGTLPATSATAEEDMPFFLTFTGGFKKGARKLKYSEYTTFSQAEDIIKRVKSKGINNISVRYNNVFEGNSVDVLSPLGGKEGLSELCGYAKSQNIELYLNTNVLTYDSIPGKADFFAARGMNKIPFSIELSEEKYGFGSSNTRAYKCRTLKRSNSFIDSLIDNFGSNQVTGFCIGDAGSILCSDFSASGAKRTEYKSGISNQISALQSIGKVMIDSGNIYSVKNASCVINIPMSNYYKETAAYRKIPFFHTVLHGITVLASPPINADGDFNSAVLNCIEYGVCPDFTTVYSEPHNAPYTISFDSVSESIVKAYNEISPALKNLEGERITGHTKLKEGIFCTEYSGGTRIYVNYTKEDTQVNGVTVSAGGFVRIN